MDVGYPDAELLYLHICSLYTSCLGYLFFMICSLFTSFLGYFFHYGWIPNVDKILLTICYIHLCHSSMLCINFFLLVDGDTLVEVSISAFFFV